MSRGVRVQRLALRYRFHMYAKHLTEQREHVHLRRIYSRIVVINIEMNVGSMEMALDRTFNHAWPWVVLRLLVLLSAPAASLVQHWTFVMLIVFINIKRSTAEVLTNSSRLHRRAEIRQACANKRQLLIQLETSVV